MFRLVRPAVFLGVVMCVAVRAPGQTTWQVASTRCSAGGLRTEGADFCTIQAAIEAAKDGDTIEVAPGVYAETLNFLGKAVAVRGTGGAASTTIIGDGPVAVVTCESGEGSGTVLSGFTITRASGHYRAPGMRNVDSGPTIDHCIFRDIKCNRGMTNLRSNPTVTGCQFIENSINSQGGAMMNVSSNPVVTDCLFRENRTLPRLAEECRSGDGYDAGSADLLADSLLTGESGGAMANWSSSPIITPPSGSTRRTVALTA